MPNREVHNRIAKRLLPHVPISKIDSFYKKMDAPSQVYGRWHRKFYHDYKHPFSPENRELLRNDPDLYALQIVHVITDRDPVVNAEYKRKQLEKAVRDYIRSVRRLKHR